MRLSFYSHLSILWSFINQNHSNIIEAVNQALSAGADLICFSELATCGYPPRDFLEFDDFRNAKSLGALIRPFF